MPDGKPDFNGIWQAMSTANLDLEDPTVFTRPWKIRVPLYRHMEKNVQLMEFKCVELVEELMYGHLRQLPATQ
jgi:hypothetical protein